MESKSLFFRNPNETSKEEEGLDASCAGIAQEPKKPESELQKILSAGSSYFSSISSERFAASL